MKAPAVFEFGNQRPNLRLAGAEPQPESAPLTNILDVRATQRSTELPRFVRDLLGSTPARGEGLNLWLFRVARVLHAFRSHGEIVDLLTVATAGQPVKAGEIERAVINSKASAWTPGERTREVRPQAKWPEVDHDRIAAITGEGVTLYDLWERSPIRFEDDAPHSAEVIKTLFPGNPLLCCGWTTWNFSTLPLTEWLPNLSNAQLIVPSAMSARTGRTKEGEESEHCIANTGSRQFLVIEFDSGTADEHAALIWHLSTKAPLSLVVHSGSKSVHAWFAVQGVADETLIKFMRSAVQLGADRATWTKSQFVRMPGGMRDNGRRQVIHYFNPATVK